MKTLGVACMLDRHTSTLRNRVGCELISEGGSVPSFVGTATPPQHIGGIHSHQLCTVVYLHGDSLAIACILRTADDGSCFGSQPCTWWRVVSPDFPLMYSHFCLTQHEKVVVIDSGPLRLAYVPTVVCEKLYTGRRYKTPSCSVSAD